MRHSTIVWLFLLISVTLNAQKTVISGKAADYSKKEISFYTIPDPVLRQKLESGTTTVAADGSFSVTLSITQTTEIYTDIEKYCGTIVVEPGKNYSVILPPYSLRTTDEAHSSYFKPALYWLGLPDSDPGDLNYAIRSFVTEFNFETSRNSVQINQKKSKEVVSEIIARLEQEYSSNQNDYFKTLKKYYFAELEYAVNQLTPEYVVKKYFATQPVQLHHPGYQRAFVTLFTDFLRRQSLDTQNRKIINLTDSGNYPELVRFFENKGYSKDFAELVVLKGLNDGYYSGSFSKAGVIKAIEAAQTVTRAPMLQPVAQQIKNKLSRLQVGGKAPAIRLTNQKKEIVTLDQFQGKFVYLSFFNSRSADCRRELDSIVSVEKKLRQVLSIVSVSLDDDFENSLKLWKTKGYSWELLDGSKQKQLIINYNASITPVFYLFGPDGTIQLSQAPFPSQGFEPMFLKMFRDFRFKQKRN